MSTNRDCSHAFLSMTPMARASAGLVPAGMLRASTVPRSMRWSRGGRSPLRAIAARGVVSVPCVSVGSWSAGRRRCRASGAGGQNTRATLGKSNMLRNTETPSTMLDRILLSSVFQSWMYQRCTASTRSRISWALALSARSRSCVTCVPSRASTRPRWCAPGVGRGATGAAQTRGRSARTSAPRRRASRRRRW